MLSIIIPTKNEEKYLPLLLASIKNQDFDDYEVIVADADSTDKTRQRAKEFGCRIVKGGHQAVGINNGVKVAKGDLLLFLDADALLPKKFLAENLKVFVENNLDIANCYKKPVGGNVADRVMHKIANLYYFSFKNIWPYISSDCMFIKKDFFLKVGFDKNTPWLIDLTFANSLPKGTDYGILPIPVLLSVRMAERLGRFRQARILLLAALLRAMKKNYYREYR